MGKIGRIGGRIIKQFLLVTQGHVLNWPWKSRLERRKTRYKATQGSALWYLSRYRKFIKNISVGHQMENDLEPDRVFTIWFQGQKNAPAIVKACFRSMRRHLCQELVVLDENTLWDWISLPDYVINKWKSGKMRAAHFCDICRVELLYQHGGVWLDSTDYVTSPIPHWIMEEDFFIYMSGSRIRGSYSFVQNCFFRAKKYNPLLGVWREAILNYWKNENSVINYFTHQLLFKLSVEENAQAAAGFAKMPKQDQDPTHTVWDAHKGEPFDEKKYHEWTSDTFFQKTEYKTKTAKNPPEGSFAEVISRM